MKLFFRAIGKVKGTDLGRVEMTGQFDAPNSTDLTDKITRILLRRQIRKQFRVKSTHITICQTI